ncbi:terminase small subunit [Vagococcus fluvialis]|uniref:terminase small subunit n=1 Tax=Vagococcus fluvialis TaxID=2738 RepID=UPI001D0A56F4|nr:terminase small subunit [Vagococcus fluvialis]UDM79589.1 terminase small subunit [Vagococcus fluvialis]
MKDWELAYKDYKDGMKYKEIAEKYGKSINTVKSWKSRYWNAITDTTDEVATKDEKVCTQKEKVAHKEEIPKAVIELNDNSNLTEQQKLFCLYYLQSFNATQSYMKSHKVSYDSANSHGYKLLSNVVIKEELTKLKQELQSEQYFTIQDIINEYAKQAFSNIKDITTFGTEKVEMEDGSEREFSYVRLKDDSEVDGALIQEVKQGKDGVSAKLWDKQKAMDMLVKLLPDGDGQGSNITIVDEWTDNNE